MGFGLARKIGSGKIFTIVASTGGGDQSGVVQIRHHFAEAFDLHPHLLRHFLLGRIALLSLGQVTCGRLHLLVLAPSVARGPIEFPQAIQNCTSNTVLSIGREHKLFPSLVLIGGIDESQGARLYQVVNLYMHRKAPVEIHGNCLHQSEMVKDQLVAAGYVWCLADTASRIRMYRWMVECRRCSADS